MQTQTDNSLQHAAGVYAGDLATPSAPTAPGALREVAAEERWQRTLALTPTARALGVLAYVASLSLLLGIVRPEGRFAQRHTRVAQVLHLVRFAWVFGALAIWWRTLVSQDGVDPYPLRALATDAGLLLAFGVPNPARLSSDVGPWIITPLVLCWAVAICGAVLAACGRSLDLRAATRADWRDRIVLRDEGREAAEEERRQARRARQRQLERLQRTTATMGVERTRREQMERISSELSHLQAEQEHIERLLALGEISRRRYDSLRGEINGEIDELQRFYGDLTTRSAPVNPRSMPEPLRVTRQDRSPESMVESLAIVTPSGVPLFTYGYFQLDEALVAGILSAFDSISAEVFGSRVHKTELAQGQVLHFAHGEHVVILAVFIDEPSPRQIEQLRAMLASFELANSGPLARQQFDPDWLTEVHPPFAFTTQA